MRRRRRGVGPIYSFAAVWLLYALLFPLYRLSGLLIATGIGLIVGVGISRLLRKKDTEQAEEAETEIPVKEEPPAEAPSPYSPEVNAIISDGRIAMKEMGRLYHSIPNMEIRGKINELMAVSDKIVRDAIDDPSDVPQIRKFLDYYLPTTIKLLNAYDRMSSQDVDGENISGSMERIEDMLDTTISAYKKQLDALFANQAADIQTDIEILNGMLAREGLGGKSYLDLKDFMKQYESQQKGSTSNG